MKLENKCATKVIQQINKKKPQDPASIVLIWEEGKENSYDEI